jgi:DNA-binding LytR/AlgR family response regulator
MDKIKCLIIDDEPLARELLVNFCGHLSTLQVIGVFGNALDARSFLRESAADLIFLDINMPVLDGIGFLNTLTRRPLVIMTTAYKEYAVNAFDLEVCDYLVKPFSLERFIVSVERAMARFNFVSTGSEEESGKDGSVFVKTDGKIFRVTLADVLFVEASGNYTKIVMADRTVTPAMPFSGLENILPSHQFLKVHRSFIVNREKISSIEGNRLFIGRQEIPIGRSYKDALFKKLKIG